VDPQALAQEKAQAGGAGFVPLGESAKVILSSSSVAPGAIGPLTVSSSLILEGAPGDPPNPCGCSPPDPNAGVGPNHVFEMVNLAGIIYLKSGTLAKGTFALSDFFLLPTSSMSDPEIIFDAASGRWFASVIDIPNGRVQFAVSTSNDPTATWNLYFVSTPSGRHGSITLPDQPFVGASDDKFVLSANDFAGGTTFIGAQYWIVNKAELVSGASIVHVATNTPNSNFASVHPAQHLGSSSGLFYMVTVFPVGTVSTATLFTVSGVPGVSTVTVTINNFAVNPMSSPPNAAQPGTSTTLTTNDDRVLSAVWESNNLWFDANDACIPSGDTIGRSCARLILITTSGTAAPTKVQDFDYAASGQYFFYPAVSLFQGQLVVVYGQSSSTVFPSLLVTGRAPGDPPNTLQAPFTIKAGTAPDTSTRYGDYFGAATDPTPSTSSTFWVAGEYRASSGFQSWNTAIAQVAALSVPPGPFDFSISVNPTSGSVVQGGTRTATVSVTLVSGTTQTVSLSASISPPPATGISVGFNPQSGSPTFTSTMTVTTTTGTPTGTYTITITGTAATLTRSTSYTLTVTTPPPPDFSLSASPSTLTIALGASGSSAITSPRSTASADQSP
jgi:hypothetical protein